MNSFKWAQRSALPTALLIALLQSCGGSSSTLTSLPVQDSGQSTTSTQISETGVFALSTPVGPVDAAGQIRIDVTSPQSLPETITIQEVSFVKLPLATGETQSYGAAATGSLVPLDSFSTIALAGVTEAAIAVVDLTADATAAVSLIYQGDPDEVTFEDYVLVRALGLLPVSMRTPENIATRANELFPAGEFEAGELEPVPDAVNTDFAAGGSVPPPDLEDALVVYAATFLTPAQRTPENLAATVNALSPDSDLEADDILSIPGGTLPGGVPLIQPVAPRVAGTYQISVEDPDLGTAGFTIGPVEFVQLPTTVFTGFTTYAAEASSSLLETPEFAQLDIDGVTADTCVIVHLAGQDPQRLVNQLSRTEACVLPDDGLTFQSDPDALLSSKPTVFTAQILHAADQEANTEATTNAPNFSAVVNGLLPEFETTLRLASGDIFIPGPFFFSTNGEADIIINNHIGFEASVPGNHEFDLGTDAFESLIEPDLPDFPGSNFPYISANLDYTNNSDLSNLVTADGQEASTIPGQLARSAVITKNGETFGLVGATTPLLSNISSPGTVEVSPPGGVDNNPALAQIVQTEVDALLANNPEINKVILLAHLQDLNNEIELAGLLENVDIIIAGGSQSRIATPTDRLRDGDTRVGDYPLLFNSASGEPVAVVNTDGQYTYVGRLIAGFDDEGLLAKIGIESGVVATDAMGVMESGNAAPTQSVQDAADAVLADLIDRDTNIVGDTTEFLNGIRNEVRSEETNLGNLTADANLVIAQATDSSVVVSIKNGGGIRNSIGAILSDPAGERVPPQADPVTGKMEGEVSQLDVENVLSFNNSLVLLTVSRQELKDILEHGVSQIGGGRTIQVGGLKFSFDPDGTPIAFATDGTITTPGTRVQNVALIDANGNVTEVLVENGVVQNGADIRLVTLNFLANLASGSTGIGGDGYPFPAFGEGRADLDTTDGNQGFLDEGREQRALAEFLTNLGTAFDQADTPAAQDERIQNLNERADTILP